MTVEPTGTTRRTGNRGRMAGLALGGGLLVVVCLTPLPEGLRGVGEAALSAAGQRAVAVLAFCLVLWLSEALPFPVTGMLGLVLLAVLKVAGFADIVRAGFGNEIVLFFLGVFVLSFFINRSGLGRRISVLLLGLTGNDSRRVLLGFLSVGAAVSLWISDMAVAAILLPIARRLLEEEGLQPRRSNFGKALMIACAWGPIVGGVGTPAGCAPNPLAIGFLRDMAGVEVQFVDWMKYGLPLAALLLLPAWGVLLLVFPPELRRLSRSSDDLRQAARLLPAWTREERATAGVFLTTVVLWIATPLLARWSGLKIPISLPVALTACLFFFPGLSSASWQEAEADIPWGSLILLLCGLALGSSLYQTGAATWISLLLLGRVPSLPPLLQVMAVVAMVSALKVVLSSNTVTAVIAIPIVISLAQSSSGDLWLLAGPAAMSSSLSLILVTSSPTNVIPYSAGYFSIADFAKAGLLMTVVSAAVFGLVFYALSLVMPFGG